MTSMPFNTSVHCYCSICKAIYGSLKNAIGISNYNSQMQHLNQLGNLIAQEAVEVTPKYKNIQLQSINSIITTKVP